MIELIDTLPDTNVQPPEYKRLLGYPRERVLEGRARELAEWARGWYATNGRPWVYARQVEKISITNGSIVIEGVSFSSKPLQNTLQQADAHSVILVAVSAGPELEQEAQRLWLDEKPDEYFFLEMFGSAVVEHLVTMTGARLCAWADGRSMAVLPHYSPGYPEWDISQQQSLFELLRRTRSNGMPGKIDVLESGMLRPKKSLLAVFGLTSETERVKRLTDLVPCDNCSLNSCQYRRAPYSRAIPFFNNEVPLVEDGGPAEPAPAIESLNRNAKYLVNAKALRRWADERLSIERRDDGTLVAQFRYEGTTCANMGRALNFHYDVTLGPREEGYPIRAMLCSPASGDEGHRFMCRYMTNAEHLMVAIDHDKPLLGRPLNDVLTWQRPVTGAGCYCEPADRKHKWGIVLETLHYALVQHEIASEQEAR